MAVESSDFFLSKPRSSIAPLGERFLCYFPLLGEESPGHVVRLFAITTSVCTLPWWAESSSHGDLSPSISIGTVVALRHDP